MDQTPAPAGRIIDQPGARNQGSPPLLVGRIDEQALLRASLAEARLGHGQLCLISGEAGIGKTTLVRDLARSADARGMRVLTGSCYDLASVPPYGPWLDLFEACQRDATLPAPPSPFAGGRLAPITDQAALFADVRHFFANLTAERPALVILEDLHWADPASLDLLRHIGPHVRHWPLKLIVTYRTDELVARRPLTQHLPAIVRESDGQRFDLRRLEGDALRSLISSQYSLTQQDEDRLLGYLQQHAEGNPFFATEILRTLEADGVLEVVGGNLHLGSLDRVTVPTLLRQVIDGRLIRLGESTRKPLSIAAVIGHEVPLALWAEVTGLPDGEIFDIVERAVAAHLLEAERDGTRVRFDHALTREALYEGILPPRRRIWHREIAEALMAAALPDLDSVAFHLQEAGDPRAADWLIMAGERAQRSYAWLTAVERFRAAAALLEGVKGQDYAHRRLLIRIFYLLRFAYPADAISATDEARRLSTQAGDTFLVGESRNLRGVLLCYVDRFRTGLVDLEQGIGSIEQLPPEIQQTANAMRDWLTQGYTGQDQNDAPDDEGELRRFEAAGVDYRRSYHSWFLAAAGHLDAASTIGEWLVESFPGVRKSRAGVRLATAFARHALAIAAAAHGRPDDARALWARAREEFGDHHVLVAFSLLDELRDVALSFGAADPAMRGQLAAQAEAAMGRALGALRPGVSPHLAWLRCLATDGRWDEASQILDHLPGPGNAFLRRETTFTRAFLARHRGQPDTAWAQILPFFPKGFGTEPGDIIHQEGLQLQRLAAGLCLDAGDLAGAEGWLAAHDHWLAWNGCVLGRAEGQLAWGELHHARRDQAQARGHLASALALASDPIQPLVRLRARRLLGEIDTAADLLTDAEEHLSAALALADACEIPYERALTLIALAELRAATGATADAVELAGNAYGILSLLGAAPALARVDALRARLKAVPPAASASQFGLSQREMEVLRLVAEGRSNPEIAAVLYISRETARTHVSNILRKLDVRSRTEAGYLANRSNLLSTPSEP